MKSLIASCGFALALGGCAVGIHPGDDSPSVSYTATNSYQTVYLRVQNQAAECLRGNGGFAVVANVDPATQAGEVLVKEDITGAVMARTVLKAVDDRHTQITHTVSGHRPWDVNALHAMRESVLMDTSVCFAYK
jgi:hypothetical protein